MLMTLYSFKVSRNILRYTIEHNDSFHEHILTDNSNFTARSCLKTLNVENTQHIKEREEKVQDVLKMPLQEASSIVVALWDAKCLKWRCLNNGVYH